MIKEVIGGCTLYHGDCLEIMPTLSGIDLLLTDPPYKVTSGGFGNLEGGFGGWIKDAYDNKGSIVECDLDWSDWLNLIPVVLRADAHAYIFSNDRNLCIARSAAESAGLEFHRLLVWDKRTAMPNKWYQQICEFVLFMRKGKAFMINDPSSKSLHSIYQRDESGAFTMDGIAHYTEKPVELCSLYIRNSTLPGETVLDPFMGSSSTGVACVRTGRRFIGIEKNERYFQMSCARIRAASEQKDLFVNPLAGATQSTFL